MDRLRQLSDQELMDLAKYDPGSVPLNEVRSERVRSLLREEMLAEGVTSIQETNLHVLKDEAFGTYWMRHVDYSQPLSKTEFADIVDNLRFPTAKSILGEAARRGVLTPEQCEAVIVMLCSDEWSWRQVRARILLARFGQLGVVGTGSLLQQEKKIIDELFELRTTWAIIEILDNLDCPALRMINDVLEEVRVVSRREKHEIRQIVRKQLRAREK